MKNVVSGNINFNIHCLDQKAHDYKMQRKRKTMHYYIERYEVIKS